VTDEERIRTKFEALAPVMDERMTRLWAAAEALALGPGGASVVTRATGIRGKRLWMGRKDLDELAQNLPLEPPRKQRVRRPGAGRKPLTETDPTLVKDLESLIDPVTRGDPESALRWTCKSTSKLAEALKQMGHEVGETSVRSLLAELGYSLQANAKVREGTSHPDRNAQFDYVNAQAEAFLAANEPVISVDTTKKKELIGDYKNSGREWHPKGGECRNFCVRQRFNPRKEETACRTTNSLIMQRPKPWRREEIDQQKRSLLLSFSINC